jgi:hypothetical protein
MLNFYEQFFCNSIVRNYPDWQLAPYMIKLGKKVASRIHSYTISPAILDVEKPSILMILKAASAYAHYYSRFIFDPLVDNTSIGFFVECYFLRLEDAQDFFRMVYFPRYLAILISKTIFSIIELLFSKNEGQETDFKVYQISLEIFASEADCQDAPR